MTREEHLKWCNQCTRRLEDPNEGILCEFTGRKADFEGECPQFNQEELVDAVVETTERVRTKEEVDREEAAMWQVVAGQQNMLNGLLGATLAGFVGAILWAAISIATNFQLALMAIAIGAGVGYAMRYMGKGISTKFGIAGGAIALISCLLGNYFTIVGILANEFGLGFFETMGRISFSEIPDLMAAGFDGMDIIFYGVAVYEGYKFSFRVVSYEESQQIKAGLNMN